MKRKFVYGALLTALLVNFVLGAQVYFTNVQGAEQNSIYPNMELFARVLEYVRKDYVDGQDLSYQDLIYSALKGMLSNLDPHSEFMEPVRYDDLRSDTQGEFGGVGIVITMKDNYLTVLAPMEDTPGFRAGILSGDRIIKIEGKGTGNMTLQDAVQELRGVPGSDVNLTIYRPSTSKTIEVTLTRSIIKVSTVKDINGGSQFPLLEDDIGYVRLSQFGEQTAEELSEAMKKLDQQGMQALILDLRANPGGLLDQAVKVAEQFLPRDQLVVTTEGRNETQKSSYRVGRRGKYVDLPMVVLVNHSSASASEIVAGCLQDTTSAGVTRAVIVGEQTFGKGSVQSILPLEDGSALRLTTAKYYTPSHKVIHENGITPDIMVPMTDQQEADMWRLRTPGGLEALSEEDRARIKNAQDPQLDRALDLLRSLSIYSREFQERRPARTEKVAWK